LVYEAWGKVENRRERREDGCRPMSIDVPNAIRSFLLSSALKTTMQKKQNALIVAVRDWNNSSPRS